VFGTFCHLCVRPLRFMKIAASRTWGCSPHDCALFCARLASPAVNAASSEGRAYRVDIATEPCSAIRAIVHASQPDSPRRVRNVCRNEYRTKGRTLLALGAFACCFLMLEPPSALRVCAGHTQPSSGFPSLSQRVSRASLTRGVIGKTPRAAAVFP